MSLSHPRHDAKCTRDNPKGFNAAVLTVIDFLGGDRSTGKCRCPIHDDGQNPSLSVNNGDRVPVVVHCFGCKRDREIVNYLHSQGVWPSSSKFTGTQATAAADESHSPEDRRRYALSMYKALVHGLGREMAGLLQDYMQARALKRVPPQAMITMPREWVQATGRSTETTLPSPNVGMVLAFRNSRGEFQGIQATWLNPALTGKREQEPKRQSYGLAKGNFIEIEKLDYEHQMELLLIGEGVETCEAATQLAGLILQQRPPAVASTGKSFMADMEPPDAGEYILLVDDDDDGDSRRNAGILAQRLVGHVVRIATPKRPNGGKKGFDWNDALIAAKGDPTKLKELARAIVEAPTFEEVMTDEEKRETRLNALARLMLDDHLAYEEQRAPAHKDLKIRLSVLDEEVERRCKWLKEELKKAAPPPPVNMELLEASAREIVQSEDVLELFAKDCGRMIAGEKVNLKLLYLVGTSRLFDHKTAMNAAIKGPSAAGKSETREAVVHFFPPECVVNFTSLSPNALIYHEEDFQHRILSMGEAQDREQIAFQDLLLRQLMSEGKLRHLVVQKVGNKLVTVPVEKNGPVAFMVTTTRNKLHPENETRLLSLEIDDSAAQTRAVVEKVAVIEASTKGRSKLISTSAGMTINAG